MQTEKHFVDGILRTVLNGCLVTISYFVQSVNCYAKMWLFGIISQIGLDHLLTQMFPG